MNPGKNILPPLPRSWAGLSWEQLTACWDAKMRYGGNADAARAAALLGLLGLEVVRGGMGSLTDSKTGERLYRLRDKEGDLWTVSPRSIAHIARVALPWFDFPYGDHGTPAEKDERGRVVKEAIVGVRGYVNPVSDWRDAMAVPEEVVTVSGVTFALPQVALNNLTWHQYRTLQALVPRLFADNVEEDEQLLLQAQFTAFSTVPEASDDTVVRSASDAFRPAHSFRYQAERSEAAVPFWSKQLEEGSPLFHICFQVYQTALANFYPAIYPLLFGGTAKSDPLHSVLSGEVGTINAVMKYAGFTDPKQVYETNLPIVFDILNTMAKEAKEIEKMNSKAKRKS